MTEPAFPLDLRTEALVVLGLLGAESVSPFCDDVARCLRDEDENVCLAALSLLESYMWSPGDQFRFVPDLERRLEDTNVKIQRAARKTLRNFGVGARTM
eukprot:CAMPEP_0180792186 /NCGR_PEP_ID=MMETSP1038_2-20121128/54256_1 /TAXON_ID=632150 /ORGANISM="Azadinium spinosum, Strain 3D9" /LENGTH=98 /DNA_ID=CAMNT_0022830471 /DNA_START=65 /DNA_END=358 /DNA_ORIENTATION=-